MSNEARAQGNRNPLITVAWIGFAGAILAAIIAAGVTLSTKTVESPNKSEHQFDLCIRIELWSEKGSQPIKGASVQLDAREYRYTATTDSNGCANFRIPDSIRSQRGTITVTTSDGRTKTINEDIRGASTSIIFYPND